MNRFLADENLPLPVVAELRSLGYDVITLQEAGRGNQQFPDEKVLHLASEQGRALVTLNRKHFIRLHHLNKKHGGIIVCSMDLDYAGQAHRIHQAVKSCESLLGLLIRINRPD
jgi:predicted nuclease of predicted toxin-antitoxin system